MSSSGMRTPPEAYGSRPASTTPFNRPATGSRANSYLASGTPGASEFAASHAQGAPMDSSPLSQSAGMHGNELSTMVDGEGIGRSDSVMSQSQNQLPTRGGTLKKKGSLKRGASLKRTSSRRSSHAGSVRSLALGEKEKYAENDEMNSAFVTPIPTSGTPTEILANRFQAWRKVLKDLITYFRDIQKGYETRSKSLIAISNVMSNTLVPGSFISTGGLGDAASILRDYNQNALNESNKAKDVENEVIMQLTGLRSDLQQKIKEIKSLSGDFKNNVERETEGTKKAVHALQESLGLVDSDPASTSGRADPFIIKLGVDRQIDRQIEEENYLHRAYLNLESSGRELESIVVGEIQKAYSAYAGIIKREADEAYETAEKLREGPIAMAKDKEWETFVMKTDQMVDPRIPLRQVEHIVYPGRDHPAAIDVRSGMLERKSKYLKNYTPGWYVLSPTHLHEFKSADKIASQTPIMSLYLPEQKLGSHSEGGVGSHKFMLKGRQTGGMHRGGHSWVFRAESHETMMAWYADIKELTEKSGEERNAFVRRQHARSLSNKSVVAPSIGSSDGGAIEDDEADAVPYSDGRSVRGPPNLDGAGMGAAAGAAVIAGEEGQPWRGTSQSRTRPQPGGRFPSDVNVDRGLLAAPLSPSSGESSGEHNAKQTTQTDHAALAGASGLPGSGVPFSDQAATTANQTAIPAASINHPHHPYKAEGDVGDWIAPTAAGAGGAALGGAAIVSHNRNKEELPTEPQEMAAPTQSVGTAVPESPLSTYGTMAPTDTGSLSTVPTSIGTSGIYADSSNYKSSGEESRPIMPHPAKSATTISDLHIPGEFPQQTTV